MDAEARAHFWELAEQAKTRGRDLAEVLDRAGVLVTPEREARIQADILQQVADALRDTPSRQLSNATNVLDFQRDLAFLVQAMADNRRHQ